MTADHDKSLGDDATFAGQVQRRPTAEMSLGDERTLGGDSAAGIDTAIGDIEIVDLDARYKPEGTLGQGGMGAVVLATDTRLGRRVAIKRILGEAAGNRMAVQRFLTEAKSIAALNHPNIVQIYDYGRAKDGPFLIMEYVDGGSLLDRCKAGALPLAEAIDLACQICDGLAKAHDLGIVHRDIKPANVLLSKDGIPKLTDFGLAKSESGDHGQTMTGAVLGTPDFMPPEQRRDASEVDHRSDLWSLAATVYQMVTGRSPKIIRFNDIPVALQEVMAKALEDRQDARYQSARELRDALKMGATAASLSAEPSTDEIAEGRCPACGAKNDSSRRFCRGCGGPLEAPCLSCAKPMPLWEEICGSCGTKQSPLVDERCQAMAVKQADAEGLLGDFEFDRAASIAAEVREQPHPKLRQFAGWAEMFLDRIEQSRTEQTARGVEMLDEAGKHEAAYDYLSARVAIESIPDSLQRVILPGMQETAAAVLERVKDKQSESRRLEALVKERLAAKRLDDLLPEVERLLVLRPDRTDVRKLREQLLERRSRQETARDEAMAAAMASLEKHEYEQSQGVLATIATAAVTPDVVRLRQSLVHREEKFAAEITGRISQVKSLLAACEFDKAAKLLATIPESRRSPEAQGLLDRATRLALLRTQSLAALSGPVAGGYKAALEASGEYRHAIALADIVDSEYAAAVAKAETAIEEKRRVRRSLFIMAATAAGIAMMIAVVGAGWWIRSSQRAAALAAAIAQSRWEDVLAMEPDNVAALVGRAQQKLAANPADVEGAFADLDRAERQPGAGALVMPVRAEAHAVRAVQHAQARRLDKAAEDLRAAKAGTAPAKAVSRAESAIAEGWLGRGTEAVANGDPALIRRAADAAIAAGGDRNLVLGIWKEYVKGRIEKLDAKGLGEACVEAKKAGLSADEEVGWWLRFGGIAATPPHENAAEVIRAADAAIAAGSQEPSVAPLRAHGLVLAAVEAQVKGDTQAAVDAILSASLLDPRHVKEVLGESKHTRLRTSVLAAYRGRFDAAVADKDWTEALRLASTVESLDKSSTLWVGDAVAALPPAAFASLAPAVISSLPAIENSLGMKLKLLPSGRFTMSDKGSSHEVTLSRPFYMGVKEVTNAEWKSVMGSVPSHWKDADRPVETVSWEEAVAFCRKLSDLPEERKAGRVYRLPTEAEWEYACRAGTDTEYSFGDAEGQLDTYGWYDKNSGSQTHPVGQKQPNGWGLYDMHGNVFEWCSDWYGEYPKGAVTDPQGPSAASDRVSRGGGWFSTAGYCRSAVRGGDVPSSRSDFLGFRLALSPSEVQPVSPEAGK